MKKKSIFDKINIPAKASAVYLGANIVGKAIGLATTPFFTRMISEDEYGTLSLYLTLLGIASIVTSSVSSGSAIYGGFRKFENKILLFTKSALGVCILFSSVICLLLFTFSPLLGLDTRFLLPLVLQILCDSIVGVLLSRARFSYSYWRVMLYSILSSALPAVLSIIILSKRDGGAEVRIYTMLVVSLFLAIFGAIKIWGCREKINLEMSRHLAISALPLLPHSITSALSSQADKLFVSSIMGQAALAKYSVVHSLGVALQFAVTSLFSSLGPWMTRRIGRGENDRIMPVVSTIFSLLCALSLGLCALAPEAMQLLAPSKYLEALPALIPIALSTPLSLLSYSLTLSLVQTGRGKVTSVSSIISLILCITMNYILIPRMGYLGAGVALLVSQIGALIFSLFVIRPYSDHEILPLGKCLGKFVISCVIGLFIGMSFVAPALRILLLTVPVSWGFFALLECKSLIFERK